MPPTYEAKGVKLTLTPFVLKAVAETLKKHPIFNSSLDEVANEIVIKEYIHLGIAVDTDQGLMVPVIRDVDKKSLLDLAKELEALAAKARDRKISADEMKGGTFTISNQGAIGGAHFTPIINLPEVAILGLGRGALKPVVREGKVEVRMMTPMALSYDHRVVDGGSAARFTVDLVKAFENFSEDALRFNRPHPRPRNRMNQNSTGKNVTANGQAVLFDHEKLDVYRMELHFIAWVTPLLEEVCTGCRQDA